MRNFVVSRFFITFASETLKVIYYGKRSIPIIGKEFPTLTNGLIPNIYLQVAIQNLKHVYFAF